MSNIKHKRDELQARQAALHQVFTEAKTENGEIDLDKVKSLGAGLSTAAKAEKIRALNDELDALGKECEALDAADAALKAARDREETRGQMLHPQAGDPRKEAVRGQKSLGQLVAGDPRYAQWAKSGAAGGISFSLDDEWPADLLAKGAAFDTIGRKLFSTTSGWAPESIRIPGFVEGATRPVQLLDILPMARTSFEQVQYMEETTRTHGAAERGEGAAFASSTFALTERTSPVRKITDSIPVTDEQLEDVAQVESYLNGRLIFGLRQRLDSQVLVGDGTGVNLRGILNTPGIQTQARGADPIPDAIFRAITRVRVTGRAQPTHIAMHGNDWQSVRLMRTADGLYIWGNPSEPGPDRMWGLPVVQTEAGAVGTAYVGSFLPPWVSLFERRGVDVQVGFVGSQFTEGRRTMRADGRFALAVFRPAAFCTVTGL